VPPYWPALPPSSTSGSGPTRWATGGSRPSFTSPASTGASALGHQGAVRPAFPALLTPRRAFTLTTLDDGRLLVAGGFDYLLKIRTRDIRRYRHVLGERISELPFVASTSTNVTMETVVDNWSARHRTT
jgi:hypothetical protein